MLNMTSYGFLQSPFVTGRITVELTLLLKKCGEKSSNTDIQDVISWPLYDARQCVPQCRDETQPMCIVVRTMFGLGF